jgi:site-specific DNA recombinase
MIYWMAERYVVELVKNSKLIKMKSNDTNEQIQKRLFKHHYLVYARKSTDEPENQKNSIYYQQAENLKFAGKENLPIAPVSVEGFCANGIIAEKHSAFKETSDLIIGENGLVQYRIERPKFHRLIHFLSNGYFKGVVILCWDRVSRNKGDETIIRKLMKKGVDFRFALAKYDKSSAGALHMDIDGMFAEHHSRVTSEKVSLTIRTQRDRGYYLFMAPVGYLNTGSVEHKPFDPERSQCIVSLFELYATGEWSLAALATWATNNGLTLPARRRRRTNEEKEHEAVTDSASAITPVTRLPTATAIQKILTNRFYTGEIKNSYGEYIPSKSHRPLISKELFQKVQRVLKEKKICVKYLNRLEYPLRGVLRCGTCKRVYTPYEKKKHIYYGCRCISGCNNELKNIRDSRIVSLVGNHIKNLVLTPDEVNRLDNSKNKEVRILETDKMEKIEKDSRRKRKLQEDIEYLRTNKLTLLKTGVYSPESYLDEERKVQEEIDTLEQKKQNNSVSITETIGNVKKLSELIKILKNLYDYGNLYEKEEIIKLLFSELAVIGETLYYKCKNGISVLQSRLIPDCAPNKWLSELSCSSVAIQKSITSIEIMLDNKI